jgi:glycosidase
VSAPHTRSGATRRPAAIFLAVAALVIVLAGGVLLVFNGGPTPSPSPLPPPSTGPAVAVADETPLARDSEIDEAGLAHDSRSDLFRTPFGAVPAGAAVTLRLRATAGDLSEATMRVWDQREELQALIAMKLVATDLTDGDHGVDYWQATIKTSAKPTILWYRFIVRDGPTTRYLEDDPADDAGTVKAGSEGGEGRVYAQSVDASWQIDVHDPDFTTPAWTRGAVVYQVFPDRFFDGDPANNPSPDAIQGVSGADIYRYGDVYGNRVLVKDWGDLPEGYCRAYQIGTCSEEPLGRDFFGGDLAGITAKLDDLADLGVTVLYLNPIFAAPSNHRYDTSSYDTIDPDLGTREDFDRLVSEAKARGIRVLLDGVFNHVSSDSPWFDRERRFAETGACEASSSPYRAWFTFRAPLANEPSPCAASGAGKDDTYYVGWFGFDTIPEVIEQPAVYDLFTGDDGVVRNWVRSGTAGWRLDVMDNLSDGFMRKIRAAVKETDPDALVLGEQWADSSNWLLGDEADSTMNYRFRRAAIGLINGNTADLDGAIQGLAPSAFAGTMDALREDYPAPAFEALLNLVDSHDTTRILWTLTPGKDDPAVKESASALAEGKAKLRLGAALQLTWPGMASIYYGTEAGLTGHDDPDDRRPYPWHDVDTALRDWYRDLGRLRRDHVALREGDIRFVLADDDAGTLGYVRRTNNEAAIVVLNMATVERTVEVEVGGILPDGPVIDGLTGAAVTIGDGRLTATVPAQGAIVLLTAPGVDLAPPEAPTAVTAIAGPSRVELSWSAPAGDAAGYAIWRSIVTGGGYRLVGETAAMSLVDTTVRNGTRYHYVIVAHDAAGNPSARSDEVEAQPTLVLADVRLEAPAQVSQVVSAIGPGVEIGALVRVDGVTASAGPTVGLKVGLGFGDVRGSDPSADYTWSNMIFKAEVDGADRFVGAVLPDEQGTFNIVVRASTDGGETWTYADRGGIVARPDGAWGYRPDQAVSLSTTAPLDAEPPGAPTAVRIVTVNASSITLAWDPVAASDLQRYEISRAPGLNGPFERIGAAIDPSFTDDTIDEGATYAYVVAAVDTSFNRSTGLKPIMAAAESRDVKVAIAVTLPSTTPPGDTVFIAGDFQGWDPGATPMTKVDDRTWTILLPFREGDAPQYKFTRGSWETVEKDAGCGEIPNRTITALFGTDGTPSVENMVEKWRDVDRCG